MTTPDGAFLWHELATTDVDAAIAFYRQVLGFDTEEFAAAGMRYVRWLAADGGVGGVMSLPEALRSAGVPPHWLGYLAVQDADASTREAEALGATVCSPPTDIPEVGRFSVIRDPQGAVFAILAATGPEGSVPMPTAPTAAHVSWNELMTSDHEKAFGFYSRLFGWRKTDTVATPMGPYQLYARGERTLGGMMSMAPGTPLPPNWLYYWFVPDLDRSVSRVAALGGTVLHGPHEVPGGSRVAQCRDPQGAMFALNGV